MSADHDLRPDEHEPGAGDMDAAAVTDAQLVRFLDGELPHASGVTLRALLEQRADLAARVAQLERRSTRLSALLAEVSPDAAQLRDSAAAMRPHVLRSVPRQRAWWLPTGVKAAAAIALLLGLVLAVPDARAWVLQRVRDVGAAIGVGTRAAPPQPDVVAPSDPRAAAVSITFAVTRDTLDVDVRGLDGVLSVRRGSGVTAAAEATGIDARFTVVPGGLQIEGPASADAVYTLTVPQRVTVLRLQRTAAALTVHPLAADATELRIELGPR